MPNGCAGPDPPVRSRSRVITVALAATLLIAASGSDEAQDIEGDTAAAEAALLTVPVTGDPTTTEVTIDHVVVRSGRSLATITFSNSAAATPVESIDEVTALVAERLPA